MTQNIQIYKCPICGNVIRSVSGNMKNVKCCGVEMEVLTANSTEATVEKHIPVYELVEDEIIVKVGSVEHPMEKEHYIMWIAQVSENKIMMTELFPEQSTETRFPYIKGATLYAYCNKHGLWSSKVE